MMSDLGWERSEDGDDEEKKETMKDSKRYRGRKTEGNDLKEPVQKKKTNDGSLRFHRSYGGSRERMSMKNGDLICRDCLRYFSRVRGSTSYVKCEGVCWDLLPLVGPSVQFLSY